MHTHPRLQRARTDRRIRTTVALALSLVLGFGSTALLTPAPAVASPVVRDAAPAPDGKDVGPDVSAAVEREVAGLRPGAAPSVRVIAVLDAPRGTGQRPSSVGIRTTRSAVLADLPDASYDVVSTFSRVPAVSLEVNAASLKALAEDPRVVAVNEDHVVKLEMTEANAITGADEAHTLGFTGAGQTVAVIDTGVDSAAGVVHPGLADDLLGQACFRTENDCIGGAGSAEDQHGHGTHVAGIITGPQGVAPDSGFYALKVFTTGDTSDTNILNALNHVISLNTTTPGSVDLVNMSLGAGNFSTEASCNAASAAYVAAFSTLNAQGVTVFVATGNDAKITEVSSPGCVSGAVGVGSTGDATRTSAFGACTDNAAVDKVSCFSNATPVQGAGELVDLLAPGCDIASLWLDGATGVGDCGTSMATPYAAGAAAVALQAAADGGGSLNPAELETLLEDTGVQLSDYRMAPGSPTFPRVNVLDAVGALGIDAPTDLAVTGSTSTSVSLDWTGSTGAAEYLVLRSVGGALPSQVGTTDLTSFTDTGVPCGELTYTVRATDGVTPSLASNAVIATARPCPLAPTDLALTATGATTHQLSWTDANPDETSVVLQRRTGADAFADVETFAPGSDFTFDDTVATCGSVVYRVVAERDGDLSTPSAVVSRAMCAPANDNLTDALAITPGALSTTQTETVSGIAYASEEASDPAFSCKFGGAAPGYHGVWYSITPTETARVTISTASTTIVDPASGGPDTIMAVYAGSPSPAHEVSCNDDISGSNFRSTITRNLSAGTTYYVHVALWSDLPETTPGDLVTSFTWIAPIVIPANDLWADAAVISTSPYSQTVTNAQNATTSPGDAIHPCRFQSAGTGNHTLWWTFTPEFDGKLDLTTVNSSGSFTDTIMSVVTGTPGSFTNVACNDDISGSILRSALTDVAVTGGTTYSILVSRYSSTATATAGTVVLDATFDASPGITRSKDTVAVDEDGTDDSHTLRLNTQPTSDVTITVTGDEDCAVDPGTLVFTTVNWATPQTVTISGVPDDLVEGDHTCDILYGVASADPLYDARSIPLITGTVTDALVTDIEITSPVDGGRYVQGSPLTADFACTDNRSGAGIASCVGDVADGAAVDTSALGEQDFTVTLTDVYGTVTEATATYTVVESPGVTITGAPVAVDEDGTDDTYTVELASAPDGDVVVAVTGDEDCAVDPAELTFTPANWSTPQTVTVSGIADGTVEGDHSCTVTHEVTSDDPLWDGLTVADVSGSVLDPLVVDVEITAPADGASYALGAEVPAAFVCTDNRSGAGITSCVGDKEPGTPVDTSAPGTYDFTVVLTDIHGNETTETATYTVLEPTVRRPDARVGLGAGQLVGNDIYGTLTGQSKAGSARRGKSVTYRVSVQNDGTAAEPLLVTGAGSARGFTVRYVGPTGTNLTGAVTGSGFQTPSLAPGATYVVTVKVKVGRTARPSLARTVTVASTGDPDLLDKVRVTTKRKGR